MDLRRWCSRRHTPPYAQAREGEGHGDRVLYILNNIPMHTKILVTNLAELTPSQVVCIDQKRWAIELMNWELKSGLGVGEHQVSGDKNRSEKSMGIAVLAYLLVMRMCHHEIVPGKPWSIFQLQHALRLRIMTNQVEHKVKMKMAKTCKVA